MAHEHEMDAVRSNDEKLEAAASSEAHAPEERKRETADPAAAPRKAARKGISRKNTAAGKKDGPLTALFKRLSPSGARAGRAWALWRNAAIILLIYVVAVNLGYFLVLKPNWARLDELRANKMVMQDFLVVRESSAAVAGFRDEMMRGDQRMTIIAELEPMAREAGVRIIGEPTLLSPKEVSGNVVEYPIELELDCNYHELGVFMSMLEGSTRFLAVREVEYDAREDDRDREDPGVTLVVSVMSWEE